MTGVNEDNNYCGQREKWLAPIYDWSIINGSPSYPIYKSFLTDSHRLRKLVKIS